MNSILFPVIVSGVSTRKDKSLLVKLETQELNPDTSAGLMRLHGNICYCMLKPDPIKIEEQEAVENLEGSGIEGKSQSQRMRSVLFLLWKQSNEGFSEFTSYYMHHTEKIIEQLKSKLNV